LSGFKILRTKLRSSLLKLDLMSSIKPLPTEVVHLIAAGEVIDSLAAVEGIGRKLDAGATRIVVSRANSGGCVWLIMVAA